MFLMDQEVLQQGMVGHQTAEVVTDAQPVTDCKKYSIRCNHEYKKRGFPRFFVIFIS